MLNDPGPTAFDLRWTMFGINVRVHPMFWLMAAFLGYNIGGSLTALLVWVGCVFVSILLHELGHVVMGRIFGSHGHIVLWQLGGLAIGASTLRYRWQRILVSFAGPGAQLLALPLIWLALLAMLTNPRYPLVTLSLLYLFQINLLWPIINLIPIWPLDGGQITREVCEGVAGRQGTKVSLVISIVVAGLLAAEVFMHWATQQHLLPFGDWIAVGPLTAVFLLLFAFNNFQELSRISAADPRRYDDEQDQDRGSFRDPPRRYRAEDLPWERPDDHARRGSADSIRRGPNEGYRRREDEMPWER